jgi:hypothetical protein
VATQWQANVTITLLLKSNAVLSADAQTDMTAQVAQIVNELHTAPRQHNYVGKATAGTVPAPTSVQYYRT